MEMEHLDQEQEHEVYGGEIPDGDMDADVDMSRAEEEDKTKDLEDMKKRLKEIEEDSSKKKKEIEEEAGALREMQAKVEKEMGAVQDPSGASATQAENDALIRPSTATLRQVTSAKRDRQTIEKLNAYEKANDHFERELLRLKDAVDRARAESCLTAHSLRRYIGENQKLTDENHFLVEDCSRYMDDRETAMDFADECHRRAEEAEQIMQELKLSADTTIKHLEATVTANRLDMETLNSKMEVLHCELRGKEDDLKNLRTSKEILETENSDLLTSNKENASKLEKALQVIRNLEDFANQLAAKLIELDKQSFTFSDKVVQLNSLYDSWFKMVQEEKDLASQYARKQYDQLHTMTSHVISENNETTSRVSQLNNNIIEVQKGQEFAMVQHAEECRFEAESNLARKSKLELLVSKLDEKINALSESARLSDTKMQDLILKFTALESERKYSTEKLQGVIDRQKQHLDALEKQVDKLQTTLEEKEQLVLQSKQLELSRQTKFDQASADVAGKSLFTKLVGQGSPFRPGYKSPGRIGFLHRFSFG